jgi:hypothetical protein
LKSELVIENVLRGIPLLFDVPKSPGDCRFINIVMVIGAAGVRKTVHARVDVDGDDVMHVNEVDANGQMIRKIGAWEV